MKTAVLSDNHRKLSRPLCSCQKCGEPENAILQRCRWPEKRVSGVLVVNAGAVGTSIDGDPRGSYAVIELNRGLNHRAGIVRFTYGFTNTADDIKRRKVPEVNADLFRRGL